MEDSATNTPFSPTYLYLIRHGQAIVNVKPIIGGMKGDRGLTDLGIKQAECLRDRLKATVDLAADILIASTLPRARETAEIIASGINMPVLFDDSIQEFRTGEEGDGLLLAEYKRRFGWVDMETHPFLEVDPGGESWASFTHRASSALSRIIREHAGKRIFVVTHGGVIDTSFLLFFEMSGFSVPSAGFDTQNTSLTCWKQILRNGKPRWVLDRYNDAAHLEGLSQEKGIDYLDEPAALPAIPTEP